jgi:hypothetical protein
MRIPWKLACVTFCAATFLMRPIAAAPQVTAVEWLRQQSPPQFKPGHTLPRLGQMHCVNPPPDVRAELARQWGYAVRLSRPEGEPELLRLCAEEPAICRPAAMIGNLANLESDRSRKWPAGTFLRKADGTLVGNRQIFSPEMPDGAWRIIIDEAIRQIDGQRGSLPAEAIATVENWTEYGLTVPIHMAEHGAQDPRVMAAKGDHSWQEYTSVRKAHYEKQLWAEIKRRYPNALHTAYTYSGFVGKPSGDWAWEYRHIKATTDLPSPECYYNYYNTGFVGDKDMLTLRLLWRHNEIQEGARQYLGWLCAGYQRDVATYQGNPAQGVYADLPRWMGYLKMSYLAGMIGGITTGEFGCEIRYEPFAPDRPPHWLDQMTVLAHAHALFTWVEPLLRESELLPGPSRHAWNQEQPAYEFPTGHAATRVVIRKANNANRWLVGAWAADGVERPVTVNVPVLGEHRITGRPEGTVHLVDRTGDKAAVRWLDEAGMTPSLTASGLELSAPEVTAARWRPQTADWTSATNLVIGDWGFNHPGYPPGLYIHSITRPAGEKITNPVIYDNDVYDDVFDDELAMVMASNAELNLVGLIVTPVLTDGWGFNKPDWVKTAHEARRNAELSGLRMDRIPPVTVGTQGANEKAGENADSAGARLYVRLINEHFQRDPEHPTIVNIGGQSATLASAYGLDPSIAHKCIVYYTDLRVYNGHYQWASRIVAANFRVVSWGDDNWWITKPAQNQWRVLPRPDKAEGKENDANSGEWRQLTQMRIPLLDHMVKQFQTRGEYSQGPRKGDGYLDGTFLHAWLPGIFEGAALREVRGGQVLHVTRFTETNEARVKAFANARLLNRSAYRVE